MRLLNVRVVMKTYFMFLCNRKQIPAEAATSKEIPRKKTSIAATNHSKAPLTTSWMIAKFEAHETGILLLSMPILEWACDVNHREAKRSFPLSLCRLSCNSIH